MTKRKKKNSYNPQGFRIVVEPQVPSFSLTDQMIPISEIANPRALLQQMHDALNAPEIYQPARVLVSPNQLAWMKKGFAEADRQSQEWEAYRAEHHRLDRVYGPQLGPERAPWAPPTKEELWAEKLRLEALLDEEYATDTAWGSGTSDDLYEVHKDLLEYYRTYPDGTVEDDYEEDE